jgi:multiple sugar transport system substrate-binding protein/sn-glycerol 3-phosphate transport system substrate-binding protein
MITKKFFARLLAVLIIASFVITACGQATPEPTEEATEPPAPEQTEEPAEPAEPAAPEDPYGDVDPSGQTIYYWHQHSREREEGLLEIVDEFNRTNEWGINVVAEYQGGYGDIFNKMLVVLNTADAPNLVVAYQNQSATYAVADAMVDMNALVESPKWGLTDEEQADFFPGFYAQDVFPTFGNARLGFPLYRSMEMMYYNADWLKELKDAGAIDFDGPPTTPEQFKAAACAAVENPFSKAVAEPSLGYELSVDASRFASWTFAQGGDVFDYNTGQYTYDNEAAVAAMEFIQDLFNEGCATIVTERYGDQTDFGTGRLLFTVGSTSGLPFYGSAIEAGVGDFEWNVAPVPYTTSDPVTNIYGASNSIPKTTPEGELAAWLFLKFMANPEQQAKWAEISNYFPVRFSVAEGLGDLFASLPQYETGYSYLEYGRFEPPVPGYDFARDRVEEAMAAIAEGADVASTLADLTDEANAILGEYQFVVPTPVPTDTPEPPAPEIGTEDNPIKVLFVPSVDVDFMIESGELIEQGLNEATGLYYEVSVPTSYAATIEEMCASPDDTIGFIPAMGYVLANQLCSVEPGLASERYGWNVYWTQFIVPRDSDIETLEDLEGKNWGYGDVASTSGYLYPSSLFSDMGITVGDETETGGHPETVRAVYLGEVDFGTTYFSAPLLPEGTWSTDMPPDVPDDVIDLCAPNEEGQLWCGDYRVLDARAALSDEAPDVVQKVRILALTPEIPNDTLSFSPGVPDEVRQQIIDGVIAFIGTEACDQSLCNEKFYDWTGAGPIFDENFDGIRILMEAQGITLENIGE